jgi:hypothetical protein
MDMIGPADAYYACMNMICMHRHAYLCTPAGVSDLSRGGRCVSKPPVLEEPCGLCPVCVGLSWFIRTCPSLSQGSAKFVGAPAPIGSVGRTRRNASSDWFPGPPVDGLSLASAPLTSVLPDPRGYVWVLRGVGSPPDPRGIRDLPAWDPVRPRGTHTGLGTRAYPDRLVPWSSRSGAVAGNFRETWSYFRHFRTDGDRAKHSSSD